jgi:hypothetical protein
MPPSRPMGEGAEERQERQGSERVTLRRLLKRVYLTLRSTFLPSMCNIGSSLYCDYMFRPNWPSSGVQVAVMNVSASHCIASSQQPVQQMMAS